MALIYDWVNTDLIQPISRCNPFAQEHKLIDHFVVLYAGNLGFSQGLEMVLASAEQLAECSDIHFLFVGDGSGRHTMVSGAAAEFDKCTVFAFSTPRMPTRSFSQRQYFFSNFAKRNRTVHYLQRRFLFLPADDR